MAVMERASLASKQITVLHYPPDDAQRIDELIEFDSGFRHRFTSIGRLGDGQAISVKPGVTFAHSSELSSQVEHGLPLDPSLINISSVLKIIDQKKQLEAVLKHEPAKQKLLLLARINIEDENLNITTALHKMTRHEGTLSLFLSDPDAAKLFRESLCTSQGFGYPFATIVNTLLCGSGVGLKAFLEHSPDAAGDLIFAIEGYPSNCLLGSEEVGYDFSHPNFFFGEALEREEIRSILSHYECFRFWLHPDIAPKVEPPDF